MLNTSVLDVTSTLLPFDFMVCLNGGHVGIVVCYVAMLLSFFLETPAHFWLLWIFLRAGWKNKPTQVLPLNLTILDLIFSIQCAVEALNMLIFRNDAVWIFLIFFLTLTWVGRPLMQVCICVEQYLAVIHPIMFLKYKGLQYRIGFAVVVCLIAVACALYELITKNFVEYIFTSAFFISVIVISFCCVSVLCALKQPGPGDTQIPMERDRAVRNQQKRKAFNTIFSELLIVLFAYLPQVSLSFIRVIPVDKKLFHCDLFPIMNTFNILGMMITPLLKLYKKGCRKGCRMYSL